MAVAQRIYARALFEAARERGSVDEVQQSLAAFAQALDETPELAAFLSNPQLDPAAKASVLEQLSGGADELVRNFLQLTAAKGRASELGQMSAEFQALVDQAQGRLAVELTTAYDLSEEEAATIVKRIEQGSGRTVEATRKVDPTLVGGLILQAGSLRVDASVRGRLDRLRRELVTRN